MVSVGPDRQSYDFTHMYSFVDYTSDKEPMPCMTEGSIFHFLYNNPKFSRFKQIIEKASMQGQLDSGQADLTIFIPTDDYIRHIPSQYFDDMDDGLAHQILNASTLNRRIGKDLLTSSPVSYFTTRNRRMRMYVTNISGKTQINNCVSVVKYDILLNNGIIHVIDGLIEPSNDTFM